MTNKIVTADAELLLLPLSIGTQKNTAMIDSGATHNFLSTTMVDILKSTVPECILWRYSAEPLRVSLADNTVVLSTKLASVKITFDGSDTQEIEFRVVPRLNHPLILGLQWLRQTNPVINWTALRVTWQGHTKPVDLAATRTSHA